MFINLPNTVCTYMILESKLPKQLLEVLGNSEYGSWIKQNRKSHYYLSSFCTLFHKLYRSSGKKANTNRKKWVKTITLTSPIMSSGPIPQSGVRTTGNNTIIKTEQFHKKLDDNPDFS